MIYLFIFACEAEKTTGFGVPSGGASNHATHFDDLNDDSARDTGNGQSEPDELGCDYPDKAEDLEALSLTGRADCGAEIWDIYCVNCHGVNGLGCPGDEDCDGSGQELATHLLGHQDEKIVNSNLYGEGTMAPIELQAQAIADAVLYIRASFGEMER